MNPLLLRFLPWLGGLGGLTIVGLAVALFVTRGALDGVKDRLAIETALHQTDIANFRAGQALANADHLAEIGRMKDMFGGLKDEADRRNVALSADFAGLVRLLPRAAAGADQGRAGGAAMPGAAGAAGTDRSGGDSVLLARADALICATNTARLQAAHDWAVGLAASAPVP